jgi:hypothetical protein
MGKKTFILLAILFLAFSAFAADMRTGLEPGVPVLADIPSQRMLVLTAQGDPAQVAGPSFDKLFRAFRARAPRADKRHFPAPRARWASAQLDSSRSAWIGSYGIPVTAAFPPSGDSALRIETWEYGLTAQVLYVGPYAGEEKAIAGLKAFIAAQDLAIAGPHEEEYVKGPGMFFKGDPAKYRTVIRYAVARIGDAPQPLAGKPDGKTTGQPAR